MKRNSNLISGKRGSSSLLDNQQVIKRQRSESQIAKPEILVQNKRISRLTKEVENKDVFVGRLANADVDQSTFSAEKGSMWDFRELNKVNRNLCFDDIKSEPVEKEIKVREVNYKIPNLPEFLNLKNVGNGVLGVFGVLFCSLVAGTKSVVGKRESILMLLSLIAGNVFLLFKRTSRLLKAAFVFVTLAILSLGQPFLYFTRAISVLVLRWLKVYGLHGVPSLSTRKLRALTLIGTFQLAAVLIIFRLFALQGSEHLKWQGIASKQQSKDVKVTGARGAIVDRNGLELAVSIPSLSIGAHPKWLKDKESAISKLSIATGISAGELRSKLNTDKQFVWLAKGLSQTKELEISKLKLFGLELEKEYRRVYPQGSLASTIIGKASADGGGLSGVERSSDKQLNAPSEKHLIRRDARGKLIDTRAWEGQEGVTLTHLKDMFDGGSDDLQAQSARKEGAGVQLTIDANIQSILEEEIDLSKESSKAKHVFGLMMDAHTGEVIAMGQSERSDLSSNKGQTTEELKNIVLQNSFEPGSTFKPIITALALEHKVTKPEEMINCENGKFPVGKYTIKDAHPVPTVSLEQVLVRSSNIGMAKLGFRLGKDLLYSDLRKFGFGESSKVGLSGEAQGIFRNSSKWANIDIATHSFGQGISVTALQMVRAYAVLANGGYLIRPRIITDKLVPLESNPRLLSKKTTDFVRGALNQVTENEHGTGRNSRIAGVPVYGKTGTAQKSRIGGVGYDSNRILASFIGFVDGNAVGVDRTLVLYIAVDEPGVWPRWGGTLAAPVFKKVMERTLSHYLLTEPESGARLAKAGDDNYSRPTL
jgi:cell division protein FtsI (penicillin-binding protein 3)